eukprot:TRINITY_DN54095_c0_g2_i1.p1 TRINITY_DN54095_c0_g2~~TRINITY_DN54095_c0_g2_i1.p1  ORF type:complete len:599 (+),score=49.71 TRINITY_DN54095_c0_g2_i1:2-1798(+)
MSCVQIAYSDYRIFHKVITTWIRNGSWVRIHSHLFSILFCVVFSSIVVQELTTMTNSDTNVPLLSHPTDISESKYDGPGFLAWLRRSFQEPTVKNLCILTFLFGISAGVVAYVYNAFFQYLLYVTWDLFPNKVLLPQLEKLDVSVDRIAWVYIPIVAVVFGMLAGLVQKFVGFPGDLPDTIKCVHHRGYIPVKQAPSMFLCSAFSINAGGSLGPEAPCVALCGAAISFFSVHVFRHKDKMMRTCTLMGLGAALAAFFGVSLGGSLFPLEVVHNLGLQHYEYSVFVIATGVVCLMTYRGLQFSSIGAIWDFVEELTTVNSSHLFLGMLVGVACAGLCYLFAYQHKLVKWLIEKTKLQEHKTPILSGGFGGLIIGMVGVFLPATLFWGEFELKTVANPAIDLPHVWPKGGFYGLDPYYDNEFPPLILFATAFAKMVMISVTVISGFRGGFIFPLMMVGSCIGKGLTLLNIPFISANPVVLLAMCFASGLTAGITRTPFATPLILTGLCGQGHVAAPCLAAALVTVLITKDLKFVKTQQDREDVAFLAVNFPNPMEKPEADNVQKYKMVHQRSGYFTTATSAASLSEVQSEKNGSTTVQEA